MRLRPPLSAAPQLRVVLARSLASVIGAFIMGTMNNGMSILGVGIDWQQAIKGTVLLIAVFFDVYNKNKGQA
jgi:putative multiple sugar transport system permease protein